MRKPELHDVLHDGLVLTKKRRTRKGNNNNKIRRSNSLSRLETRGSSAFSNSFDGHGMNNSALFEQIKNNNLHHNKYNHAARAPRAEFHYNSKNRLSRSLSPFSLCNSPNHNLARQNHRSPQVPRSASRSVSPCCKNQNATYDILPDEGLGKILFELKGF